MGYISHPSEFKIFRYFEKLDNVISYFSALQS